MHLTFGYICSFSLLAPKENEPKEMRFAAAQIPAKISVHSLNGENLQHCIPFRVASDSSPFFTLIRADFFTPPFARRRFTELSSFSSHGSEKVQLDFFCIFFKTKPLPWSLAAVLLLGVRDNDCSGILFVRKDLAENVPSRPTGLKNQ
ncbi:MAG: hypothetical protein K5890_01370 [Bacteroidales bacterium]|nr:hypothetical protein [Bacteroidales bacterium]